MSRRSIAIAFSVLLFSFAAVSILYADWTSGGKEVCTEATDQMSMQSIPDGAGGMITVWEDTRNGDLDIFAQRINQAGSELWTSDGVTVCSSSLDQRNPQLISDGSGGAIITWQDYQSSEWDIYAQRLGADGTELWTSGGIVVSSEASNRVKPHLTTDGAGGAIIAWEDYRNGNYDVFAQRVDASGSSLWTANGIPVIVASLHQLDVRIDADGSGGAVMVWRDYRTSSYDLYAQRVTSNGLLLWNPTGVMVCESPSGSVDRQQIISDGSGGAYIAWEDPRGGGNAWDIYAQRIDSGGSAVWTTHGIGVCTASSYQARLDMIPDGTGDMIVTWYDGRNVNSDIYAQRVDSLGASLWTADGLGVCLDPASQSFPAIATDGSGGAVIAWQDSRISYTDIFAQHIDADGDVVLTADGVMLCQAPEYQEYADVVYTGSSAVIVIWEDMRNTVDIDLYAQRLQINLGYVGQPEPLISSAVDNPSDEGGAVILSWKRSLLDQSPNMTISHYSVWRATEPVLASMGENPVRFVQASDIGKEHPAGAVRVEKTAAGDYYWEMVGTADAYYLAGYSYTVPTRYDSMAGEDGMHYFQVIAHDQMSRYTFYISAADSGYSVDNLSPAIPLSLAGEQLFTPEGLQLTWEENTEPDLGGYAIFRGVNDDFVPSPGNQVATVTEASFFDDTWEWEPGYWYKVAAFDIHDNQSGYAVLGPVSVTGDEPVPPLRTFLAQNYPNPFNPNTIISFDLEKEGFVNLSIFDAAGRLVAVLIDESRPAGQYAPVWNGKAQNGTPSASGVYFYRLIAGDFTQTRKMVLLR